MTTQLESPSRSPLNYRKTIAELTDESIHADNMDWGAIMELCDNVNLDPSGPDKAVSEIIIRLKQKNFKIAILALTLLDSLVKNCGSRIHVIVASNDVMNVLESYVNLSKHKEQVSSFERLEDDVDFSKDIAEEKAVTLLQTWARNFVDLPLFSETLERWKDQNVEFPIMEGEDLVPVKLAPQSPVPGNLLVTIAAANEQAALLTEIVSALSPGDNVEENDVLVEVVKEIKDVRLVLFDAIGEYRRNGKINDAGAQKARSAMKAVNRALSLHRKASGLEVSMSHLAVDIASRGSAPRPPEPERPAELDLRDLGPKLSVDLPSLPTHTTAPPLLSPEEDVFDLGLFDKDKSPQRLDPIPAPSGGSGGVRRRPRRSPSRDSKSPSKSPSVPDDGDVDAMFTEFVQRRTNSTTAPPVGVDTSEIKPSVNQDDLIAGFDPLAQ